MIVERCAGPLPCVSIPAAIFADKRLSTAALGLLAYCLAQPLGAKLSRADLRGRFNCGKEHLRKQFKDLEALGYASLATTKTGAKFTGTHWIVTPTPTDGGRP